MFIAAFTVVKMWKHSHTYIYIYVCVCVCVYTHNGLLLSHKMVKSWHLQQCR